MTSHGTDYKLRNLLGGSNDNYLHISSKPDQLNSLKDKVLLHLKCAYQNSARNYSLRSQARVLKPGQKVFVRSFAQSDAANKFAAKLFAAIVNEKIGQVAYTMNDENGKLMGLYHFKGHPNLTLESFLVFWFSISPATYETSSHVGRPHDL